jgi:hypothetical protein
MFKDAVGRTFKWFSSSSIYEVGSTICVTATIKGHDTYKDLKQTNLTRVTLFVSAEDKKILAKSKKAQKLAEEAQKQEDDRNNRSILTWRLGELREQGTVLGHTFGESVTETPPYTAPYDSMTCKDCGFKVWVYYPMDEQGRINSEPTIGGWGLKNPGYGAKGDVPCVPQWQKTEWTYAGAAMFLASVREAAAHGHNMILNVEESQKLLTLWKQGFVFECSCGLSYRIMVEGGYEGLLTDKPVRVETVSGYGLRVEEDPRQADHWKIERRLQARGALQAQMDSLNEQKKAGGRGQWWHSYFYEEASSREGLRQYSAEPVYGHCGCKLVARFSQMEEQMPVEVEMTLCKYDQLK